MKLFLTTNQLAARWQIQPGTIRLWRWYGKGPNSTKIGGVIRYYIEDIEKFEKEQRRSHTTMAEYFQLNTP